MSNPDHQPHDPDPRRDPGSAPTRLFAILATLFVVSAVVLMQSQARNATPVASTTSIDPPGAVITLIGRYSVGAARLLPNQGPTNIGEALAAQLESSFGNDPADAIRVAIVKGELLSTDAALADLATLLESEDLPEPVRKDADILHRFYSNADNAPSEDERASLRDHHHWFADLALARFLDEKDAARLNALSAAKRTTVVLFSALAAAAALSLVGLVLFIILVIQRASGNLPSAYVRAVPGGSVYLEAFALFLAGFIAINFVADPLESILGFAPTPLLIWLLALVPFYPLLRGQPWSKHRFAMGLHTGRGVFREIGAGILGYVAGLPIFILGILATLALALAHSWLSEASGRPAGPPPSHPIVDTVGAGGILGVLILYSMVSVWAPFVEECMFRGAFYHHLRARFRPIFSALVVGFVFAIIHPPGIIAVPALMSLAVVFALIREWRGSIIGPMVAHALHNGGLITMLLLMVA